MRLGPCLCGDTACPSCGPAQGYPVDYREEDYCGDCGHKLVGAPCGDYDHTCCPECDNRCMVCEELEAKVRLDVMDEGE